MAAQVRPPYRSLLIVIALIAFATSISYADEVPSRERRIRFTYQTEIGPMEPSASSIKVWIPLPREDASQRVSNVSVESPVPGKIVDQHSQGNRLVYFEASKPLPSKLVIKITADVTRTQESADLGRAALVRSENNPERVAEYLQPDKLVPTTGRIATISADLDDHSATPLEQARIIYEYVTSVMRYDKSGTGWGRGDAIYACDVRRGNCTDFHSLFIALARASGIPARFTIGFPLGSKQSDTIPGYHCWAEFYVGGQWIPVDASEASKHPKRHDYYFGNLDADRVAFTMGRDLTLNPIQDGAPVNFLVYPLAQVDGRTLGKDQVKNKFDYFDLRQQSLNPETK
jgi:transglutaminase-like putative cysteine protease